MPFFYRKDGNSGNFGNRNELAFPLLMRDNCQVFSFKNCNFSQHKSKEGSARVSLSFYCRLHFIESFLFSIAIL